MEVEDKIKTGKLWTKREDRKKDPIEFFRENYDPSTTRSQLAVTDSALYKTFWRRGLLDAAIPNFDHKASEDLRSRISLNRFGGDVFGYYMLHYPGKTRGEIGRLDPYLYEKLNLEGLLEKVPVKKRNKQ